MRIKVSLNEFVSHYFRVKCVAVLFVNKMNICGCLKIFERICSWNNNSEWKYFTCCRATNCEWNFGLCIASCWCMCMNNTFFVISVITFEILIKINYKISDRINPAIKLPVESSWQFVWSIFHIWEGFKPLVFLLHFSTNSAMIFFVLSGNSLPLAVILLRTKSYLFKKLHSQPLVPFRNESVILRIEIFKSKIIYP